MDLSNDSEIFQSQLPSKREQQKYKKIKVLGQGSMGKVYLVESSEQQGKLYVMKRIYIGHLQANQKQQALLQAKLHQMVRHENIIEFKQIYHTTKDKLCIIMQYADNGDLDGLIKNYKDNKKIFNQDEVLKYFVQICLALKEIHDKKIVHRDLKGANIFLSKDGKIKIGDFGISKAMDKTVMASKSFAGTPYYLSPEMVEGKPYSTKADVWALGVILYNLCALKLPFDANSLPVLALKILKGAYPPLPGNHYSKQLKNLISSMLQVDQKKRPSMSQILCKPILSKYLPKDFVMTVTPKIKAKVQLKTQKIKLATNKSKKQLKMQCTQRLTEQQKKKKRQQQKLKREQQRKKMLQDIKAKRAQASKQQGGVQQTQPLSFLTQLPSKTVQNNNTPSIPLPKKQSIKQIQKPISSKLIKGPNEQSKDQLQTKQKPWKNKNNIKVNNEPGIEIHLPGERRASKPEIEQTLPKNMDFELQIFVKGENPYLKNKDQAKKILKQLQEEQSEQIQQSIQSQPFNDHSTNLQDLLANVQRANNLANNLAFNPKYQQIQLYEQSQDFDNTINNTTSRKQLNPKPSNKLPQGINDQQNMKFITNITNTQNLEQLRQILQDRLGQEGFIKAHKIIKQHFEHQNQQQLTTTTTQGAQQQQAYLFNRKILRKKLGFLSDQQFDRNVELLYTISIMEDMQMMRNFEDESGEQDRSGQESGQDQG